jgi:hypothetical protein
MMGFLRESIRFTPQLGRETGANGLVTKRPRIFDGILLGLKCHQTWDSQ